MTLSFVYRSPETPGNAAWTVDLGTQAVRLASIAGLITEAELGSVGQSSLIFDDPSGSAGHDGDAIVGLKQFSVNESACPSGNRRIFEGYVADRRYARGGSSSPSLRTAAARTIDMTLVDLNAFASFRVFTPEDLDETSSFNRPAETDIERVTALLAVDFLSTTLFDGLVSTGTGVDMDAVDYAGQRPSDVLNDCAQQSGRNWFVFYDEAGTYTPSAGDFGLFYEFNDSPTYPAYDPDFKVSNVLDDVDITAHAMTGPTWGPEPGGDAVLVRDPSRVVSGLLIQNGAASVYGTLPATSYTYGWRDAIGNSANLKTAPQAEARAARYLAENSTEDDRITFSLWLPSANVNDWKEGQWAQVKFSHLPGYEGYRNVRCICRTVSQDHETSRFYHVKYECTPMLTQPSGAFDRGDETHFSTPTLPRPTTPGNLLLLIYAVQEPISIWESTPPELGATPWTEHAYVSAYDSTPAIGPPGAVGFGIFSRRVEPGEVTTTPVGISGVNSGCQLSAWLWELPASVGDPVDVTSYTTGYNLPGLNRDDTFTVGTAMSGWVVGGWTLQLVSYGARPTIVPVTGDELQSADHFNDPDTHGCDHTWSLPWTWIAQLPTGGVLEAQWTQPCDLGYNHEGACGAAVVIPGLASPLPTIPYPANQVGT